MSSLTRGSSPIHKRTVVFTVDRADHCRAHVPGLDALVETLPSPTRRAGRPASVEIAESYNGDRNGSAPLLPVVTLPKGRAWTRRTSRADLKKLDARLERLPEARIASYTSTGDKGFVSKDGRTLFSVIYPRLTRIPSSARTPRPRRRPAAPSTGRRSPPAQYTLTGFDALAEDSGDNEPRRCFSRL